MGPRLYTMTSFSFVGCFRSHFTTQWAAVMQENPLIARKQVQPMPSVGAGSMTAIWFQGGWSVRLIRDQGGLLASCSARFWVSTRGGETGDGASRSEGAQPASKAT